jgi:hypothetical protein
MIVFEAAGCRMLTWAAVSLSSRRDSAKAMVYRDKICLSFTFSCSRGIVQVLEIVSGSREAAERVAATVAARLVSKMVDEDVTWAVGGTGDDGDA